MKDDRVGCAINRTKYGALKGGQHITSRTFNAISQSPLAHAFSIAVPSLETMAVREALWACEFTLRVEWSRSSTYGGTAPIAGARAGKGVA